jgi:uncharacterized protein GlcG (DUF336 family)
MRIPLVALALAAMMQTAAAQTPAPLPPVQGAKGLITTHTLSIDMAEKIARGAVDKCRQIGFHTTIAVVDASGELKAFLRDDGTAPHTVGLAKDKAYTAVTLANRFDSSLAFATARNSTLGSPATNIPGVVGIGGGVPIKYHDEVIGAVGSSGAVGGDNDEICAKAGIASVADQLR